MTSDKFTIIRDTREKGGHGWNFQPDPYCEGTVTAKLDTGDYSIQGLENILCIERKMSVDEFANNCVTKRWQACMKRMSEFPHAYILFEFAQYDVDHYPSSAKVPDRVRKKLRVPAKYIQKVINTAKNDYGIYVLFCNDKRGAEEMAYKIMRKAYDHYLRR